MEGAVRVFARDFQGATLSVAAPDGNAAWIVTPGGAWCRNLFIAGALTEVTDSGDMLRCRVADPTGAFDLVIGGRRAELAEVVRQIAIPSFVTVTGTAQGYQKNGDLVVSVRPTHIRTVDRAVRDQWVLVTADHTIARLELLLEAMQNKTTDERYSAVTRHYATDRDTLRRIACMVEEALQVVKVEAPKPEETVDTRAVVMEILKTGSGPKGMAVQEIIDQAAGRNLSQEAVLAAIESLVVDDECYQPVKGYIKLL